MERQTTEGNLEQVSGERAAAEADKPRCLSDVYGLGNAVCGIVAYSAFAAASIGLVNESIRYFIQ